MSKPKFELGWHLAIGAADGVGTVIGRTELVHAETSYLLRFKRLDGSASEAWWSESALRPAIVAVDYRDFMQMDFNSTNLEIADKQAKKVNPIDTEAIKEYLEKECAGLPSGWSIAICGETNGAWVELMRADSSLAPGNYEGLTIAEIVAHACKLYEHEPGESVTAGGA